MANNLPPSPPSWPIVGNLPEFLRKKPVAFRWVHLVMKELNTDICLINIAGTNIIPVSDPAIAREMLKKQDTIFAGRPAFSVGSHGISGGHYMTTVVAPYDDHLAKMRKVFTSEIVSPARQKWLHEKCIEEADNLVFYVNNHSGADKSVNLRAVTQHYCGNVIRKVMFGKRFFGEATADGGPGPMEIDHVEAVFGALKYLYSFSVSYYLPFLSGLDLLVQESDVPSLNYVKACARESFRLHPLAAFNVPHAVGYFIPKGSHALLSRYGLGCNPKVWADPLKFDPERHLQSGEEVVLTEHDLRFISFSTGRRGCVGALLGSSITNMLLARLIQCFPWALPGVVEKIELREAEDELLLASPLIASATPRLAPHLYPALAK
nr:cytochrome P450 family 79 [Linum usitatissimum]